jgi:hypothetical protein
MRSYQFLLQTLQWSYRIRVRKEDAFRFAAALEALRPTAQAQAQLDSAERTWLPGLSALPVVGRLMAGATGHAPLWMAVLADTGASVIVVANALRLLRAK